MIKTVSIFITLVLLSNCTAPYAVIDSEAGKLAHIKEADFIDGRIQILKINGDNLDPFLPKLGYALLGMNYYQSQPDDEYPLTPGENTLVLKFMRWNGTATGTVKITAKAGAMYQVASNLTENEGRFTKDTVELYVYDTLDYSVVSE
jgi:hypothetical protein